MQDERCIALSHVLCSEIHKRAAFSEDRDWFVHAVGRNRPRSEKLGSSGVRKDLGTLDARDNAELFFVTPQVPNVLSSFYA